MLLADNMHLKTYMIIPASGFYTVKDNLSVNCSLGEHSLLYQRCNR